MMTLLTQVVVFQDLRHKPKYLLTLTVGLKQKDFVNQCVKKVCFSRPSCLYGIICNALERLNTSTGSWQFLLRSMVWNYCKSQSIEANLNGLSK